MADKAPTRVNGTPVTKHQPLKDGDRIELGPPSGVPAALVPGLADGCQLCSEHRDRRHHAAGKLDDAEMKAFNQEVASNIDTFLQFVFPTSTIGSTLIRSCQSIASVLYPRSRIERYSSSCSKRWRMLTSTQRGQAQEPGA